MASEQANLLTVAYRRQQLAVRAAALQDISRAWPLWTPGQVKEFGRFTAVAVPLLGARYNQAAALAAGYYRRFREAEGVRGGDTPRLPPGLRPDDVVPSLRATALAGTMRALRAGFSPQAASQAGLTQALGTAGRLALNGGRDAIVASVAADPAAAGWQRIASGGACDFCRMLAGRGPAYKGERTASFEAHDHCACSAEPVYSRAPAPASGGGGLAGGGGRGAGAAGAGAGGSGGGRPPAPPAGGQPGGPGPEDNAPETAAARAAVDELLARRPRGGAGFDEAALDAAAVELQRIRTELGIRGKLDERVGERFSAPERRAVDALLAAGANVTRIPRNTTGQGLANPDIYLDGRRTDIKTFTGGSARTLKDEIERKLKRQADQVVVDVRAAKASLTDADIEGAVTAALAVSTNPNARVRVLARSYDRSWTAGGG
jgi:hypothetical protein